MSEHSDALLRDIAITLKEIKELLTPAEHKPEPRISVVLTDPKADSGRAYNSSRK